MMSSLAGKPARREIVRPATPGGERRYRPREENAVDRRADLIRAELGCASVAAAVGVARGSAVSVYSADHGVSRDY